MQIKPGPAFIAILAGAVLVLGPPLFGAQAQQGAISVDTEINLDECLVLDADDFGATYACPGYQGFPLYVVEADLRFFVSFGFGAPDEPAAGQTLPPVNTIGPRLEWRLSNSAGRLLPFAAIARYHTQAEGDEPDGEIIVVIKIEQGNTCHIAHLDAGQVADAEQAARDIADARAETFDCATDQIIITPN